MINEASKDRGRLKGYMWECVILRLLEENDFVELRTVDNIKTRQNRGYFLEMRGRGAWHQIDCPCDYRYFIPFINPIRLLGEVKFYVKPIQKNLIREFIGAIKDIQENYFVTDDLSFPSSRFTELGVFFSANGFQPEAERLAFAHNIKTVSHMNVPILQQIKNTLQEMERNYLSASLCVSANNQQQFIELFRQIIADNPGALSSFISSFRPSNGFERLANQLRENIRRIRSNFIANTSGGALLHFVSEDIFPDELFAGTDSQLCRVFVETIQIGRIFYLEFTEDTKHRRFYFNPPESLSQAAFFGARELLSEKERILRTLHVARRIEGINRSLVLKLDTDWIEDIRRGFNA